MAPRIGVVVFPGTNCEHDVVQAVEAAGGAGVLLWHGDADLGAVDAVVLPGGFAHGDYLRPGALARFSPVMEAVRGLRPRRRPGGRHLQRLPGPDRGRPAAGRAAEERAAALPVPAGAAAWSPRPSSVLTVGRRGRRRARRSRSTTSRATTPATTRRCAACRTEDRIVLRYADNPNGSVDAIAGIANEAGNVVGLMPHPERASSALLGSRRRARAAALAGRRGRRRARRRLSAQAPRPRDLGLLQDRGAHAGGAPGRYVMPLRSP